jgi:cephalosporin-C deacetylase
MRKFFPILLLLSTAAVAQQIHITPNKPSAIYAPGEKIEWKIEVSGDNAPAELSYTLKKGGQTIIKQATLALTDGAATLDASLDEPNAILAEFKAKFGQKEIKTLAGVIVSPEKIKPASPRPDDFDAFWAAKVNELHDVPMNAKLEPTDSGKPTVEYFNIQMDNINGSHIYGQLAKPKKEGKFPALLIVQWAGVYGLNKGWVIPRGEQGWLALNIEPHDLPFDQPEAFYKQASETTLKNYMAIGNEDREKSYFLRMYLSCYRAADYLASREDWDGKTLVVMGTSQGGQQSLVMAGFHPKITAMLANVPSGCDTLAPTIGRAAGFPYWYSNAQWKHDAVAEKKILETSRYFDPINFSYHTKCPALVSLGLIDETCPPTGVWAAVNQFQGPKEVLTLVNSDHQGKNNSQAAYFKRSEEWLRALVKGEAVPPK